MRDTSSINLNSTNKGFEMGFLNQTTPLKGCPTY